MNAHQDPSCFIHDSCADLGFAASGICVVEPTKWAKELRQWLEAGKQGEMAYLERHMELRIDPREMMPGARSIICVADRYHDGTEDRPLPSKAGLIARYSRGEDYHTVMKRRLHRLCDELSERFPDEQFRACVDTAPVLEREHAARAGLGAIGKHTLLLEPGVGSYLLLGEVLTTLKLEPSTSMQDVDHCGTCTRCIDACPTNAITPWSVDATRCISYLTIEHRGAIDEELFEPMGHWIFGCDICQEACPHNQPTELASEANVHEAYESRREGFDLLDVLNWSEEERRAAFATSALKRAKLDMMKRNAVIAAGNVLAERACPDLERRLLDMAGDEGEVAMVRETARAVLKCLGVRD